MLCCPAAIHGFGQELFFLGVCLGGGSVPDVRQSTYLDSRFAAQDVRIARSARMRESGRGNDDCGSAFNVINARLVVSAVKR
jgi:hypothetical protein